MSGLITGLDTKLSTWQTKDCYFNGKSYLKTLNPKKTWWRHLLYVIATRRKPDLFISEARCCLSTIKLCKMETISYV